MSCGLQTAERTKFSDLTRSGAIVQSWGGQGTAPGQFHAPHMLAADTAGNLYVAEILNKRLQKNARTP